MREYLQTSLEFEGTSTPMCSPIWQFNWTRVPHLKVEESPVVPPWITFQSPWGKVNALQVRSEIWRVLWKGPVQILGQQAWNGPGEKMHPRAIMKVSGNLRAIELWAKIPPRMRYRLTKFIGGPSYILHLTDFPPFSQILQYVRTSFPNKSSKPQHILRTGQLPLQMGGVDQEPSSEHSISAEPISS